MAYDNSSLTGDEICDYYYDIENNFMNPSSPTGYFIYKVIGGAFVKTGGKDVSFQETRDRRDRAVVFVDVGLQLEKIAGGRQRVKGFRAKGEAEQRHGKRVVNGKGFARACRHVSLGKLYDLYRYKPVVSDRTAPKAYLPLV